MSTSISSRRQRFLHAQCELGDAQVLVAEVEDLAAHRGVLRLDQGDVGLRGVPDVHEGAPHLPAVVEREPALGERVPDEGVDHQVVAHPGRIPVDRALAERDRAEGVVGHRQDGALRLVLGDRVGGARRRPGRSRPGARPPARPRCRSRRSSTRRRGRSGFTPRALQSRASAACHGVHLVVGARVVLGGRIVGQTAHVDDGVDPVQYRRRHRAHVGLDQLDPVAHGAESGSPKKKRSSTRTV